MNGPGPAGYAAVLAATLLLTLVLTPLALGVAVRRRLLDRPGGYKAQGSPIPYLGGAAMVVAFAAVVLGAALADPPESGLGELATILATAVVLSLVGLADDLRGLSPWLRLGMEACAGLVLLAAGIAAQPTGVALLDGILTVLWVVGVTNAFNLLDNMDGLTAGVASIAATFFFVIAAANGQFLVATLAIALAGCAAGFLRHNFHPARIYMGDAGSLFIGFLVAVLGIKLRFEGPTEVTFFVPILVLGVALFDTALVIATRLVNRRSVLSGSRDHVSHRLVFMGIPVPAVVSLIYAAAVGLGWLGLVMSRVDRGTGLLLMALVLGAAVFAGVLLALVPVYDTSTRRRLMVLEVVDHEGEPQGYRPLEASRRP